MLGLEAERRLTNFFVAVGEGERDIEFARSRLCSIGDFVPRAAFQRCDRSGDGTVTSGELTNFLRENGNVTISESEVFNLVAFFDGNGDRRLTCEEFVQMFLPCEDNYLRSSTSARYASSVLPHELLPKDIEFAMVEVIAKEINLQRRLEGLKSDLSACLDYSAFSAFNSVERFTRAGCVDTVSLGEFLRNQGHFASEAELVAIIRRMDTNGDSTISSGELAEFLRPLNGVVYTSSIVRSSSPVRLVRESSPVRVIRESSPVRVVRASSPMRVVRASSPVRYSSPMRTSPVRYSSPVRTRTSVLVESPVSYARSLSAERRVYSTVYVSPSRYESRYYDPLYTSKYYPYTSSYSRYPYGSYYSPTLGRYVAY